MSRSKLNIDELELAFDAILASIDENEINEWYRFDKGIEKLDKFYAGEFQPVEVSDIQFAIQEKRTVLTINDFDIFDYQLDCAC